MNNKILLTALIASIAGALLMLAVDTAVHNSTFDANKQAADNAAEKHYKHTATWLLKGSSYENYIAQNRSHPKEQTIAPSIEQVAAAMSPAILAAPAVGTVRLAAELATDQTPTELQTAPPVAVNGTNPTGVDLSLDPMGQAQIRYYVASAQP